MSLTVVAIQPPSAIYREEQRFAWWTYALIALIMALGWSVFEAIKPFQWPVIGHRTQLLFLARASFMGLPTLVLVGLLRMTTLVTPTNVGVWFGFVPTYRRAIPIESIARVEVVQYRPVADYGGWGIRYGRDGERVLNARGDRGVRFHLIDGSKILIGSQRPEQLALAVEGALRPGH